MEFDYRNNKDRNFSKFLNRSPNYLSGEIFKNSLTLPKEINLSYHQSQSSFYDEDEI